MLKHCIYVLLAVMLPARGFPAPVQSVPDSSAPHLTLRAAEALALQQNPMTRVAAAGLQVAEASLQEARAARLPGLAFRETFTNSNNPVYVFGSLLEQGQFGPQNFAIDSLNNPGSLSNFRSSLSLRLPLFDRFQTGSRVAVADIRRTQADAAAEWTRQQLRLQVVEAYFGYLVAGRRREVAEQAVRSAEADLANIRAKVETGVAVASDQLAMEVQLADFRQQLVQAEGEERIALAALNTTLGLPVEAPHQVEDLLVEREFPSEAYEALLAQALANRPDYLNATREVDSARHQLRGARGQYWPDLNLFAEYGHSGQDWGSGSADFAVGASLNFNLLDFGRGARIEQVRAGIAEAQARADLAASQVRLEVLQAAESLRSAQARVRLAATAADQAAEALRIVQDRHQVGLTTITEVLRAQTALLQTRLGLVSARFEYFRSYARLRMATGSLHDLSAFSR
jgi:outer membrane protein TolC